MKSFELIPYLFLSLPLFVGCSSFSRKATYPKELDYSEQRMEDQSRNIYYKVNFVVDGDTLTGIIDTGCSRTILRGSKYQNRKDLLSKTPVVDAYDSTLHLSQLKIKEFSWGDVYYQNLTVLVDNPEKRFYSPNGNLIGLDILSESIVQFDHSSNLIRLSRNKHKLKPRGVRIPCRFDSQNRIFIPITLSNGKVLDFFLDTGYGGELRIGKNSYKVIHSLKKPLQWKFLDNRKIVSQEVSLCDISLAGKTYLNTLLLLTDTGENLLGVEFLKRFKSVTIDYINKELYFEFPEEYTLPGLGDMNFSKDTISNVSLSYISSILDAYNTYGFFTERQGSFLQVARLEADIEKDGIHLGDTLVGINHLCFDVKYLDALRTSQGLQLCVGNTEQDYELENVMSRHNEGTFYLLKNGVPYALKLKRRKYLKTIPTYGYTYSPNPVRLRGISLMLYPDNVARKLSIHIPFSPLIDDRIIELDGIDDKGNTVPLSNRPKGYKISSDKQR